MKRMRKRMKEVCLPRSSKNLRILELTLEGFLAWDPDFDVEDI